MELQLVSKEVAFLAKEVGFKPDKEWNPEYVKGYIEDEEFKEDTVTEFKEENYSIEGYALAPEQELLAKWLRDVHKLYITVEAKSYIEEIVWTNNIYYKKNKYFKTYEEAMEDGLLFSLNRLKDLHKPK